MQIKIKKLKVEAMVPTRASEHASGYDLYTYQNVFIPNGEIRLVDTGIAIEIPVGYEAQIRPRSGLALKNGLTVLNSPGTIDADYRGSVGVIIMNLGNSGHYFHKGDRIAQMVITKHEVPEFVVVSELSETNRSEGGFGSTGN